MSSQDADDLQGAAALVERDWRTVHPDGTVAVRVEQQIAPRPALVVVIVNGRENHDPLEIDDVEGFSDAAVQIAQAVQDFVASDRRFIWPECHVHGGVFEAAADEAMGAVWKCSKDVAHLVKIGSLASASS